MAVRSAPSPQQQFGAAVRRHRVARGYSQEELAQRAGIHRNYAGAVERGERNVAIANMARIAAALGVTLATLVAGIGAVAVSAIPIKRPREKRVKRAS